MAFINIQNSEERQLRYYRQIMDSVMSMPKDQRWAREKFRALWHGILQREKIDKENVYEKHA